MSKTTQTRLRAVMAKGNLTVADLSRWFVTPYATVRQWIEFGREPRGGPKDIQQIGTLLGLLETMIRTKHHLPVPKLPPKQRIAYLNKVRRAAV